MLRCCSGAPVLLEWKDGTIPPVSLHLSSLPVLWQPFFDGFPALSLSHNVCAVWAGMDVM